MRRVNRDGWTFLTNHGHVLVCLAGDPDVLLRDVAARIGITERAVQHLVGDLERAGIIVRVRVGRRNRYVVRREERFRHPLEAGVTVGDFVDLVERGGARRLRVLRGGSAEAAGRTAGDPGGDGSPIDA
jgi:DNA-binding transcriptional ArsR family regulator